MEDSGGGGGHTGLSNQYGKSIQTSHNGGTGNGNNGGTNTYSILSMWFWVVVAGSPGYQWRARRSRKKAFDITEQVYIIGGGGGSCNNNGVITAGGIGGGGTGGPGIDKLRRGERVQVKQLLILCKPGDLELL